MCENNFIVYNNLVYSQTPKINEHNISKLYFGLGVHSGSKI